MISAVRFDRSKVYTTYSVLGKWIQVKKITPTKLLLRYVVIQHFISAFFGAKIDVGPFSKISPNTAFLSEWGYRFGEGKTWGWIHVIQQEENMLNILHYFLSLLLYIVYAVFCCMLHVALIHCISISVSVLYETQMTLWIFWIISLWLSWDNVMIWKFFRQVWHKCLYWILTQMLLNVSYWCQKSGNRMIQQIQYNNFS